MRRISKRQVVARVALVVAKSFCAVGFSVGFDKSTGDINVDITLDEYKDPVMAAIPGLPDGSFNMKRGGRRVIPWAELEQAKDWHDVLGVHLEALGLGLGVHDARST